MAVDTVESIGVTSYAERKKAEAQVNQLLRIDAQGDVIIRKYAAAVKDAAIYALRKGKRLELTNEDIEPAIIQLTGLALLSYFTAARTFHKAGTSLELAKRFPRTEFDKNVSKIAKNFEIDVGVLSKRLRSTIAPSVRESLHKVKREINSTLSELSSNKVPTKQAVNKLTKRLEEMGVTPNNGAYVETLVRTHSQMAYNAAQHVEFAKDDLLWGYKYVTVGDDRVRPEHARLDGLVKKKGHEIWRTIWPPNGWNCRCQVLAIYDEDEPESRLPNNTKQLVDPAFRFNPGLELV